MFMVIFLFACLVSKGLNVAYTVDHPSNTWVELSDSAADRAWRNPKYNSLIYVKANCGNYFEDRTLQDSLLSLTRGLHTRPPISTENIVISNREGLFRVQDSELDGVPVRLGILVVSKNNCLYDFLLISPQKSFKDSIGDFMNTAQSLNTDVNLNRSKKQ